MSFIPPCTSYDLFEIYHGYTFTGKIESPASSDEKCAIFLNSWKPESCNCIGYRKLFPFDTIYESIRYNSPFGLCPSVVLIVGKRMQSIKTERCLSLT